MPAKPILPIRQDDSDDSDEDYYDECGELPLRHAYIHSLAHLLHACLLRGDIDRAKRAWAILVGTVAVHVSSRHVCADTSMVDTMPRSRLACKMAVGSAVFVIRKFRCRTKHPNIYLCFASGRRLPAS